MTYIKIPERHTIRCDNCGFEAPSKDVPTYWAQVDITRHEDWAGGKSTKHYCDDCYKTMKITFGV